MRFYEPISAISCRRERLMQGIVEPGEAIRRARREAGLTQKDLADLSGVSERTVRAIETGRGNPTVAALVATAGVLGLRVSVA